MKKVIFFIGSLRTGGVEAKIVRNFLPYLVRGGRVTPQLLLLQDRGEFLSQLPQGVEMMSLDETPQTKIVQLVPRMKAALKRTQPNVVVSCMWYSAVITYLARKFSSVPFKHIVHDTIVMSEYVKENFERGRYSWLKLHLIRRAYRDAEALIVVSKGVKRDLIENFDVPGDKIQVIYNPLDREMVAAMASEEAGLAAEGPYVVAAGRLTYQKGFDILIKAFRKVRDCMNMKLLLLGDGEERGGLERLARSLNLGEDVIFLGMQQNPFKFMAKGKLFCSPSRYEGLSNVILEAMALGLPVVATDCPSGPSEILGGGKYGVLVPCDDPDAFADAMIKILSDSNLGETFSRLSLARSRDFDAGTSLQQWECALLK